MYIVRLRFRAAVHQISCAIAVAWPGLTVAALVILFAVYAFIAAGLQVARGFGSRKAGSVAGHLLLAIVDLAAGIVALVWPGITALALVLVIAVWAVAAGVVEVILAFSVHEPAGYRALLGITGVISVALGVAFAIQPGIGAITIAEDFGLYSIVGGVAALIAVVRLKRGGAVMTSAEQQPAAS
ncbi:MAG: hypothetical protein QOI28_5295 [Mycobacterium sp.]|nr:hypothetical protein [Mycobacterium sp.]